MVIARRSILRVVVVAFALLLSAAPAAAGGWATVRLDEEPTEVLVEVPTTFGFTVRQHDTHPVNVEKPTVFAQHRGGAGSLSVPARPDGPTGHYVFELAFPADGEWKWGVEAEPWGKMAFATLNVFASLEAARAAHAIADQLGGVHPAGIHAGTCDGLNSGAAFDLDDVRLGPTGADAAARMVGAETGLPVATSVSTIDVSMDELVGADHAINVLNGGEAEEAIACGDVGGLLIDDDLAVGLRERDGSGHAGVALLRPDGERTEVTIYLARDTAGGGPGLPTAATSDAATTVSIVNGTFSPATLEIAPGTSITWTNDDPIAHSVMGNDLGFDDSPMLDPGQSFTQTFDEPGRFTYQCGPHPSMTAVITVT